MKSNTRMALALVLVVVVIALAALVACQAKPTEEPEPQGAAVYSGSVYLPPGGDELVIDSGGALTVNSGGSMAVNASATVDFAGNPQIGTKNVYPVGNASAGKIYASGMTSGVIQAATLVPTAYAISTVTSYGCAPKNPAYSGAWTCGASLGASNQITITLYENDATPAPTAASQKAVWWVSGN